MGLRGRLFTLAAPVATMAGFGFAGAKAALLPTACPLSSVKMPTTCVSVAA